jgi:glutamyl-tRNA synthetase
MNRADVLSHDEIDSLFPADLPDPAHWEQRYPPRALPAGAEVTRFCPSPTGSMHIGGIYVAMIDSALAEQSGGAYLIRIEDTDQEREVEGALAQFDSAFAYFGVVPGEHDGNGAYGPYTQSQRADIYLSYARQLLREHKAYLCFATKDELAAAAAEQRAAKRPTGYYGAWALWRDVPAASVRERLAAGEPYVVRFRSPGEERRITYTDRIRGPIETEDNRNDIVILKSSESTLRLPTYHFAHVVDDHLMRATVVVRGEEWLPSVPVHLQLCAAAGFAPFDYAHIASLMKLDGKSKRKLSKRKDPEASVSFYIAAGYPADGVKYYLRGLMNGRLAELPVAQALNEPIRLEECGVAGPLVDLTKLEDITADLIADMSGATILGHVQEWARTHDPELAGALEAERERALRALSIERDGVPNPRKDLRKWGDFRPIYGYFLDALFQPVAKPDDERFGSLAPNTVRSLAERFLADYQHTDDGDAWFANLNQTAVSVGFAPTPKEYKADPDAWAGSTKDAAQAIRVLLTGSLRSPGFHLVTGALGEAEVRRRVASVLSS